MRAGRNKIARNNANMASKVIPIRRNGSDRSHTKGQRIMAMMASGQHSTNSRHQPTITSNAFTEVSPRFQPATLTYPPNRQVIDGGDLPDTIHRHLVDLASLDLLQPSEAQCPPIFVDCHLTYRFESRVANDMESGVAIELAAESLRSSFGIGKPQQCIALGVGRENFR